MKRRILSIALALVLICTLLPFGALRVHADDNGMCGDELMYVFSSDSGHLTIYGPPGEMYSWYGNDEDPPWYDYRDQIKSVYMYDGATSIGYGAFEECMGLTDVTIANTVTSIQSFAFDACLSLKNFNLPNGLEFIGGRAFADTAIDSITIPNTVTSIGAFAFAWCENMTFASLPASVIAVGEGIFANCPNFK